MKRILFLFLLTLLAPALYSNLDHEKTLTFSNAAKDTISLGVLPHPMDPNKNLFYHYIEPNGTGPFPILMYLHGRFVGPGILGVEDAENYFREFLNQGYAILVPSMPGFGMSDGPFDYLGAFTMNALNTITEHILKIKNNEVEIGVFGFGLGASAALALGTIRNDLFCIVASNGVYDLKDAFTKNLSLKKQFREKNYFELTPEEIKKRSVYFDLEKVSSPTLLIHATEDPVISSLQCIRAHDKLKKTNAHSDSKLVPLNSHMIPKKITFPMVLEFANKHVRKS